MKSILLKNPFYIRSLESDIVCSVCSSALKKTCTYLHAATEGAVTNSSGSRELQINYFHLYISENKKNWGERIKDNYILDFDMCMYSKIQCIYTSFIGQRVYGVGIYVQICESEIRLFWNNKLKNARTKSKKKYNKRT